MFSRNSSSSRAESITKKLERVKNEMFIPDRFAKNCKGMSNKEWLDGSQYKDQMIRPHVITPHYEAETCWKQAGIDAIESVKLLNDLDVHKQHANRLLEPFEYITVIVTASEYDNFFAQRCPRYMFGDKSYYSKKALLAAHPDSNMDYATQEDWDRCQVNTAQPEMMELAEMMFDALQASVPTQLESGQWHIPFGDNMDEGMISQLYEGEYKEGTNFVPWDFRQQTKIKIATARCAKVSFLNHDGSIDYAADLRLYDFLIKHLHMSPTEHVARAMTDEEYKQFSHSTPKGTTYGHCNNIRGFVQHRWEIENG
jgi:hypothetical protein